jgi:hypothetical protein
MWPNAIWLPGAFFEPTGVAGGAEPPLPNSFVRVADISDEGSSINLQIR